MQLALLLAVLASILFAENSAPVPGSAPGWRVAGCVAAMAAVAAMALAGSQRIARRLRRDAGHRAGALRQFSRLRRAHLLLWLATVIGISAWGQWSQLVRQNWRLDGTFLVADLLILLPVWLPLVIAWRAFYAVEHAVESADAVRRGGGEPPWLPGRFVALHARHYLGIIMAPVLLLLACQDAANALAPQGSGGLLPVALLVVPLGLLLAAFPLLLRCLWKTESLPAGPLRQRIEQIARDERLGIRDIRIWHTEGRMTNAAVAGLVPRIRYLFLTDGLLQDLTDDEISAVVRHEAGHVRCHHLPLRMAVLALPVWLWSVAHWSVAGSMAPTPLTPPLNLLLAAIMIAYAIVALGLYSRLLEHEADLWACGGCDGARVEPGTFISALEKLAPADERSRRCAAWLHPSLHRRIQWMLRAESDPRFARRITRRTRWLARSIVLVAVAAPLVGTAIHSALAAAERPVTTGALAPSAPAGTPAPPAPRQPE